MMFIVVYLLNELVAILLALGKLDVSWIYEKSILWKGSQVSRQIHKILVYHSVHELNSRYDRQDQNVKSFFW